VINSVARIAKLGNDLLTFDLREGVTDPEVIDQVGYVGRTYLSALSQITTSDVRTLPLSIVETVVVEQTNVIREGTVDVDGYTDNF
jgi:hypothetical protein